MNKSKLLLSCFTLFLVLTFILTVSVKAENSSTEIYDAGYDLVIDDNKIVEVSKDGTINVISPKPTGITNQIYFRSASTLGNTSQIFESNGVLYAHYSSQNVTITNACIAGKGTATTVAALKKLCTNGVNYYNVFFYH